jgi:hypothetical protein
MQSTEILNEIKNQLEQLEHKGYDKNSFKSGYLLGYAKALQLLQPDVSISLERAKKYARHQHYVGTQQRKFVEFEDWAKD